MDKAEKRLLKIYEEVYQECDVDFNEIKEKDRDWWFMHYYVPLEKQQEIVRKNLRWMRGDKIKSMISTSYWLGASPSSKNFYYELERHDGLMKKSDRVKWIDKDNGESFTLPAIGRSLLMSPFKMFSFTWMTTPVEEITREDMYEIHFRTRNSNYILRRLNTTE